jgi:hypothetical protein
MAAEEDDFRHEGASNSFMFDPDPRHEDILTLADRAEELGYRLLFREAGYSLEEVQSTLHEQGPDAFLGIKRIQEDISPKAPLPTVEQYLAQRLARLAPQSELIITDPYFFPSRPRPSTEAYAASVARLVSPLLVDGVNLTVVVDRPDQSVLEAVERALKDARPTLNMTVVQSNDFHDRFWIADRTRGAVLGTSLNKIGSRVFFIDSLSDGDVSAIMAELQYLGV